MRTRDSELLERRVWPQTPGDVSQRASRVTSRLRRPFLCYLEGFAHPGDRVSCLPCALRFPFQTQCAVRARSRREGFVGEHSLVPVGATVCGLVLPSRTVVVQGSGVDLFFPRSDAFCTLFPPGPSCPVPELPVSL